MNPVINSVVSTTEQLIIDLTDSYTTDDIFYKGEEGERYEWEWEWECLVPREGGEEEEGKEGECIYEGGEVMKMPGKEEGHWEGEEGKNLRKGVPLMFVVRIRVRDWGEEGRKRRRGEGDGERGELVSEGRWVKVFSPVVEGRGEEGGGEEIEMKEERWMCEDGSIGYSATLISIEPIVFSDLSSLWSEDQKDFGELEILTNNENITQIRCSCENTCSEPLFIKIMLGMKDKNHIIHYLYEPSGILPPFGENCLNYSETLGGDEDIVSGLSFVVLSCNNGYFLNGIAIHHYWSEVIDDGSGVTANPVSFPAEKNAFGPFQVFLSCGSVVRISKRLVGYGDGDGGVLSAPKPVDFSVIPWQNDQEESVLGVQNLIEASPTLFLQENYNFSVLLTMSLSCFPTGTFFPLDSEEVIEEILSSPVPQTINGVLNEAALLAVLTGESLTTTEQQQIIDRNDEYLGVLVELGGDEEMVLNVGNSIITTSSNIFSQSPTNEVEDAIYSLISELEIVLSCTMECGENPNQIDSEKISVGVAQNILENLQTITLGGTTFLLPDNLSELQGELGGIGECVYAGYSLIYREGLSLPTASLTFYSVNCSTGDWEEIPISLSNSILISIPKNNQNIDGCEKEELEECVSGDSLTTVNNPEGCEVYEETEDNIICACTHLTAFSALFTLNDSNCEKWKWGIIQTVALSILCFCFVFIAIALLLEYHLYHRPAIREMKQRIEFLSSVK